MKIQDGLRISGKVKIDTFHAGMVDAATPILDKIRTLRRFSQDFPKAHGDYVERALKTHKLLLDELKAHFFIGTAVDTPNLVMDSPSYGLDLIIQRLVGINTYSLNLLWIEIGTGTTSPNVNDTGLTSPSLRLPVSFQEDYGATDAIVQAYVTDANLANATYGEVGSFVDGTSTIGTGQLFNHALLSPAYAKVSGQDTTIEIDITIVNS
jgi:hypothetical protein